MTLTAETLKRGLNDLAVEARRNRRGWSDTRWTKRVKQLLVQLAGNKYETYASGVPEATDGEWMCDVVWWHSGKDELLHRIPLVAECEWPKKEQDVWDDFQKLLISCAEVRVLIFQCSFRDHASSLVEELKRQIQCFDSRQEGEKYLFASYVEEERPPFSVKKYVFKRTSQQSHATNAVG